MLPSPRIKVHKAVLCALQCILHNTSCVHAGSHLLAAIDNERMNECISLVGGQSAAPKAFACSLICISMRHQPPSDLCGCETCSFRLDPSCKQPALSMPSLSRMSPLHAQCQLD